MQIREWRSEVSGEWEMGRVVSEEWGEWSGGLRRCNQNRKVLGYKPTRRSGGLSDPTSFRGSR